MIPRMKSFVLPFDDRMFPTVFDKLLRVFPFSLVWSSLGLGIAVYLFGLLIALIMGFQDTYLKTLLIRHNTFAIFLSFMIIGISKKEIIEALEFIRPCFDIEDEEYITHARKWMSTIFSRRGLLVTWIVFIIIVIGGSILVFYLPGFIQTLSGFLSKIPFRVILRPEWFDEPKPLKIFLLDFSLVIGAIPFSLGIWAAIKFPNLILELTDMNPIPIPGVLLNLLRKPTDLFLRVSFIWFILSASSGLMLFEKMDIYSLVIVLLIGSIGIMVFFLPQFAFHHLLEKSHTKLSELIVIRYKLLRDKAVDPTSSSKVVEFCSGLSEKISPKNVWVFNLNDIILLIVGQLVSLAGTIWQAIRVL